MSLDVDGLLNELKAEGEVQQLKRKKAPCASCHRWSASGATVRIHPGVKSIVSCEGCEPDIGAKVNEAKSRAAELPGQEPGEGSGTDKLSACHVFSACENHTEATRIMLATVFKAAGLRDEYQRYLTKLAKVPDPARYLAHYDATTDAPPGCTEFSAAWEQDSSTCPRIENGLCPATTPAGLIRIRHGGRAKVVPEKDQMGVWKVEGGKPEFTPVIDHVMRLIALGDDGSRVVQLANRDGKQILELPKGSFSGQVQLESALEKTHLFHTGSGARYHGTLDIRRTIDLAAQGTVTHVRGTPVWGRTTGGDWISAGWSLIDGRWVDTSNDGAVIGEVDRHGRRKVHRKPAGATVMGAPVFNPHSKLGLDFVAENLWLSWGPVGVLTLAWHLSVLLWDLVRRKYSWFSPMGLFSPSETGKSALGEKPSIFCGFGGGAMQFGTQATRPAVSWMTSSTSSLPIRLQEYDPNDRELRQYLLNVTQSGGRDKMGRSGSSAPESEIYRTSVLFDGQSFEGPAASMNRFAAFKIKPQMRERGEEGLRAWRQLEARKDDYRGAVAGVIGNLAETTPEFERHLDEFVAQMGAAKRAALVWAPSVAAYATFLKPFCVRDEVERYVHESILEAGAESQNKTIDQRFLDGLHEMGVTFAATTVETKDGIRSREHSALFRTMSPNFWGFRNREEVYVNLHRFAQHWQDGLRRKYHGGDPDEVPGLDAVRKIIANLPGCVGHTGATKVQLTFCGTKEVKGTPCSSDGRSSAHIFRIVDIDLRMRMIFPEKTPPRDGLPFTDSPL